MNGLFRIGAIVAGAVFLWGGASVRGQWIEREYPLLPGWNAIYLEIDPATDVMDTLLSGLPIEEVWTRRLPDTSKGPPPCQDPDDPTCVPPVESDWEVWVPASHPARLTTNLLRVRGGRVYLMRAAAPCVLATTGKPNGSTTRWTAGFNLGGLHVVEDPNAAPTFGQYFVGAPAFVGTAVYEILSDGSPALIPAATSMKIKPGVGYWIRSNSNVEHDGPVSIDSGSLRGVDFGLTNVDHHLRLTNRTPATRTVTVEMHSSASTPAGGGPFPANAGDVPVSWLQYVAGPAESALQWHALTSTSWNLASSASAAARSVTRLSIDRTGLPAAVVDEQGQGSEFQSLLLVRDGLGWRRWLPVVGQSAGTFSALASGSGMTGRAGLYFGHVTVNEVQWVTAGARVWTNADVNDPTFDSMGKCVGGAAAGLPCDNDAKCPGGSCEGYCVGGANNNNACAASADCPSGRCSVETDSAVLRPAPAEFTFPVLMHLAADGTYTLLTEVTLLWQPPDDVAQTPGRFVLATPACPPAVCDALEAASIQDGEPFARRMASAAFSFDGDLALSGDFDSALSGGYIVAATHPLNPFRHRFHPDHDCDQTGECFDVGRAFTFTFSMFPPAGDTQPGWGDRRLGGSYSETISGLHKSTIAVAGNFEVTRVSSVAVLNAP